MRLPPLTLSLRLLVMLTEAQLIPECATGISLKAANFFLSRTSHHSTLSLITLILV